MTVSRSCCETWIACPTLPTVVLCPPRSGGVQPDRWRARVWRAACPTPAPNGAQTLTVDAVALPFEAHGRTRRHSRYVIVIALVHNLFFARSLRSISHVGYHGRGRWRSWLYHSILSVIIFVIALLMVQ